jgi:predicted GNAT superfamily acetyltransferase
MTRITILESIEDIRSVEQLQRQVWPGDDIEVVPAHLLITVVQNGGLLIGAYEDDLLVGFTFGFPGLYNTPDGPRLKHCSHMLGVLPGYESRGIGFLLKRAQWQMVRHQGLDRITWTYDPLLSRNAHLNIARLGAVCSTYLRDEYGPLRDGLNAGLPTDRFQVDWWINSRRVETRLSKRPRQPLELAHYLAGGSSILNPTRVGENGLCHPTQLSAAEIIDHAQATGPEQPLLLMEIPADFSAVRKTNPALALDWRLHIRQLTEALFASGYIVTDFLHLPGETARSFYVLSHGDAEIGGFNKA